MSPGEFNAGNRETGDDPMADLPITQRHCFHAAQAGFNRAEVLPLTRRLEQHPR